MDPSKGKMLNFVTSYQRMDLINPRKEGQYRYRGRKQTSNLDEKVVLVLVLVSSLSRPHPSIQLKYLLGDIQLTSPINL